MADAASPTEAIVPHRGARLLLTHLIEHSASIPLVLLIAVVGIYGYSLTNHFILDDYHCLEVMADYAAGQRDDVHIYQFINGGARNAAARRDGSFAWWLGDDVKYRHWRPLAEYTLYGQYLMFGRNPLGYRLVNLFLYWVGCCCLWRLFRHLTQSKTAARWAAVFFLVHAAHAIPVSFISSQADVIALVLVSGGLLAALNAAKRRKGLGAGRAGFGLAVLAICYAVALGFKESVLPVAVLPFWVAWCAKDRLMIKTATMASGLLIAIGLVWLYFYSQGNYGSNTTVMLDPIHRTTEYLTSLPGRILILLTALAIPINPFIFYFRPYGEIGLYIFCALGVYVLYLLGKQIYRSTQRRYFWLGCGWMIVFLPLLVCTVPDDRILMLPSIGFAALIGSWVAHARQQGAPHPRAMGYVGTHAVVALSVTLIMSYVGYRIERNLQTMVSHVGELTSGDKICLVNSRFDAQVLFGQQTLQALTHRDDVGFACLTEAEYPQIERLDARTLRMTDESGFFSGFLGAMGSSKANSKKIGDVFDAGFYRVTITGSSDDKVTEIELAFDEPLESERYHFFEGGWVGEPKPWTPPPIPDAED